MEFDKKEKSVVQKSQRETREMPAEYETFVLERTFTGKELERIKLGFAPKNMEQKWFIYFEQGKLYIHRSWTGACIFIVEFNENNEHTVTVNRDKEQYRYSDVAHDIERLNMILNNVFELNA